MGENVFPQKIKHRIPIHFYLLKTLWNQYLYSNDHHNIITNSYKMETIHLKMNWKN